MKLKFLTLLVLPVLFACSSSSTSDDMPSTIPDTSQMDDSMQMEEEMEQEEEMEMEEEMEPSDMLMGEFVAAAHPTMGKVVLSSERTTLQITNFKSDNGPILEMYLSTDTQATDYISLGELQGLEGDFTYNIPNSDTVDFTQYKYVMVWCVEFSIDFGHALLE
ncbi:MAG: DM13 domain-containing protein [Allomuricauda sp.]